MPRCRAANCRTNAPGVRCLARGSVSACPLCSPLRVQIIDQLQRGIRTRGAAVTRGGGGRSSIHSTCTCCWKKTPPSPRQRPAWRRNAEFLLVTYVAMSARPLGHKIDSIELWKNLFCALTMTKRDGGGAPWFAGNPSRVGQCRACFIGLLRSKTIGHHHEIMVGPVGVESAVTPWHSSRSAFYQRSFSAVSPS
jgi:hypothetical protein